jgi:choline kinase
MQAVILAGGEGRRLREVSEGRPKCLLEIGDKPVIEHQIASLTDNGIHKILVILGHQADMVRAVVGKKAEFIENARYKETNSLYSLWLARDWIKGPFVLMNCDVLFHPEILDRLLKGSGNALAYDSTSTRGLEQTKVVISKGRVVDLGKDISSEIGHGESIGLLRFDEEGARALFKRVDHIVQNGDTESWSIEGVRSACAEIVIRGINIAGLPWAEIDFPGDLERARKEVWPQIQRGYWKRVIRWRRIRLAAGAVAVCALVILGIFASRLMTPPPVVWETIDPLHDSSEQATIVFPEKGRTQKWWLCRKGGAPVVAEVEGPEIVYVGYRLLLPPKTTAGGEYVAEILLDGRAVDWEDFKAVPKPDISYGDFVVCDKDRVKVVIPAGKHILQVRLLAGTSDLAVVRFRRAQSEEFVDDKDDKI